MKREVLVLIAAAVLIYLIFVNEPRYGKKRMKVQDISPDGRISSKFGPRTLNGKQEVHTGVDIAAPKGTPIYSPIPGIVYLIRPGSPTAGNYVIIRSGSRYWRFLHMDKINPLLTKGQDVARGTLLGTIGNTGRSTGPHLHIDTFTRFKNDGVTPADFTDPNEILKLY